MKLASTFTFSAGAALALLASSGSAGLIIEGSFSGSDFSSGSLGTLSGSFSAFLDDAMYTGVGFENLNDLAILTSLTLNPNPLGTTTFDTSNVGVDLTLNNGIISSIFIGGLPNVSGQSSTTDDFLVAFSGSTGNVTSISYTIASEDGVPDAGTTSGSFSSREASVPVPATVALLALGLAFVGSGHKKTKL